MADDPSPKPAKPKAPSGKSSDASKKDANHPDPLVTPDYPKTDPSDPLSPEQLRSHELKTEEALRAYDRLVGVAKHPETEPAWPDTIEALQKAERRSFDLIVSARAQYEKQCRTLDRIARLDMSSLENIKAADQAEDAVIRTWQVWRQVFSTYEAIHEALAPNKPLRADGIVPPATPEP
jgi:hypothetical protein